MDIDNEEYASVHDLGNLPVEILLHIWSFLDSKFISTTLSCVCQRFNEILKDDYIWKNRIVKIHDKILVYPALPVIDTDFDWRQACIDIECQHYLWKNKGVSQLTHHYWNEVHYGDIHAILLLNNGTLCATGGRDRSIALWNLSELRNTPLIPPYEINEKAHKGWIWSLVSGDNSTLHSCSWDTYIRSWSVDSGLQETASYKCTTAVLALAVHDNLIAAGLYNSRVIMFDTRTSDTAVGCIKLHQRSVLAIEMDANYIISASEDQTLAVWDRRAGKCLKHKIRLVDSNVLNLDTPEIRRAFPRCMSYNNNLLYVGDSKGYLHLVNPVHGKFEPVQCYNVGHTGSITGIQHGTGYLITGSADRTVRVLTPTNPPEEKTSFTIQGSEITGMSYQGNILATSGISSAVEFWIPNNESS